MQDKETKKTLTYLLVAGMALMVAWEPWRPAPASTAAPELVGQRLFPKFENPLAAKSLEVVTFNEENATVRDFKVAQTNGLWSIPSHSNYPADAKEHMAKAATALMDVKILSIASDKQGDQKTFGVVAPDPKDLKVGSTGVGTQVTVRDGADKILADLIIGKPVKDAPQLRYVREKGRDAIYTVAVKTDEFSTKFGDWIEKDLLKLNALDVREISLNDYSSQSGMTPDGRLGLALEKRSEIDLGFNDAKSEWSLIELREFDREGKPTTVTLTADEQLDSEKLNAMKTALDDLQIVDVERKPAGLSHDQKATDEFANNREAILSLQQRGFVPASPGPGEPMQIYSSEGEVTCATKDGVKYLLRFGNLADSGAEGGEKPADGKEGEAKTNGPSRYLFVTAQFDDKMIPKPELSPVPGEEPAEAKPADAKPEEGAAEKPAAEAPAETPAAEEAKPEGAAKPDAEADKPAEPSVPETKTALQEEAKSDAKAAEQPVADKPADAAADKAAADAKPAEPTKPATPEEAAKIAVQKENKRRQDEYDAAIKAGQDKVKELNDRFADWYYIISDDVYKKIHLGRKDIIQAKQLENVKDAGNLQQIQQGLGEPAIP
jgi:hypothetical protein